jgi:hypothetical protein
MASAQKTKITKQELKDLIVKRLGYPAILVVHRHEQPPGYYTVGIVTEPSKARAAQQAVNSFVDQLRPDYDLKDD